MKSVARWLFWLTLPWLCTTVAGLQAQTTGTPALVPQSLPPSSENGAIGSIPGGMSSSEIDSRIGILLRSWPQVEPRMPRVAPPRRIRVSQGVSQAFLLKKVDPEYPPDARRTRIQGIVILHVLISKDGDVASVELVSGHEMLAPAAIECVKQWKYRPYLLNGQPMEVDTQVSVSFVLAPG